MRTFSEHAEAVRALLAPLADLAPEPVPVRPGAAGRVLAADVVAPIDLPPFANSQMDGYAVRHTDSGRTLSVASLIGAGRVPPPLEEGSAAPVMTGAPIPDGADAVVPIEEAHPDRFPAGGATGATVLLPPVEEGRFVRAAGSDVRAGELLLPAGTVLEAPQLGLLAAAGIAEVAARRRPRVLVVSTGDELAAPGEPLTPGRIHDANGTSLAVALVAAGAEVAAVVVVPDDADRLSAAVRHAPQVDLVVTSGGVSHGAFEVVRDAWSDRLEFVRVALQPAGPQGLGTVEVAGRVVPALAFPGNPVSVLVSLELFLRPVLCAAAGLDPDRPRERRALAEGIEAPGAKHQVRRAIVDDDGRIRPLGGPGSHLLRSYALATHLLHVPLGTTRLEAGDEVETWRIG